MLSSSRKKALNKSTRFEINPKSVYTSRDEGFKKNSVFTRPKKMLPFAAISAKIQENGFNEQEYCCFSWCQLAEKLFPLVRMKVS